MSGAMGQLNSYEDQQRINESYRTSVEAAPPKSTALQLQEAEHNITAAKNAINALGAKRKSTASLKNRVNHLNSLKAAASDKNQRLNLGQKISNLFIRLITSISLKNVNRDIAKVNKHNAKIGANIESLTASIGIQSAKKADLQGILAQERLDREVGKNQRMEVESRPVHTTLNQDVSNDGIAQLNDLLGL
ncbi:MAG: hypothetical protein SP4CHLAM5_06060 [Chlamydiia bacterium]|nr:hypothetical protein [Chlamydiia bacterium]MCH9618475.1 hypothetical protein [Chlamydiia bacterium]MCH9623937.1 hypothetical protein [Chlamydiia bacterium]